MKRRLFALVTLVAVFAPGSIATAGAEEPVLPPLSSVGVPVTMPAPCIVYAPPVLTDTGLDLPYQPPTLNGPRRPNGPQAASTVPAAWNDGASGHHLAQSASGMSDGVPYALDADVAVDDRFVVQTTATRLRVSARAGDRPTVDYDLARFMAAPPTCWTFGTRAHPPAWIAHQPSVYRDPRTERWFVAATVLQYESDGSVSGRVQLAVSLTSDPTAGYALYVVSPPSADKRFFNWPKFAVTDDKVVFSWDTYVSNTFVGSETVAVPKLPLVQAAPTVASDFPPDPDRQTMSPARQYSTGTAAYVAGLGSNGTLLFDVVDGTAPGSVTRTAHRVAVTPWTAPPVAEQPGSGFLVPGGGHLQSPVQRDGVWWGSMTEGCAVPGVADRFTCVRMWQLSLGPSGEPTLGQEFDIAEPGVDLLFPANVLDAGGHLAVALERTSNVVRPGVVVVGQAAGSPANTVSRTVHAVADTGGIVSAVWGTYAGAAVAPDGHVWLAHGGAWRTEVTELRPAPFAAWAAPARPTITPGSSTTSTITLSSLANWSGSVSLSVTGVPSGSSASLSATTATVPAGGSATVALAITAGIAQPTDFVVAVRACAGSTCHVVDVTVQVQQFTVAVSPSTIAVDRGGSIGTLATVTVTSAHGWSGTVSLAASTGSPATTATLDRTSVTLSAGGSATAGVTVQAGNAETANKVPVTVEGCAGYCRRAAIEAEIRQFWLYSTPSMITVAAGERGSASVFTASLNGWQGTVAMSVSGAPAGTTASLSASSVTLTPYQHKPVTLSVDVGAAQTSGFLLTVQGCTSFCRTTHVRVDLRPPYATVTAVPTEHTMLPGDIEASSIAITSKLGYAGDVVLSTSGAPPGTTVSLSHPLVTLAAGETEYTTMDIQLGQTQTSGFEIEVTAHAPDWSWSSKATVTVHVG